MSPSPEEDDAPHAVARAVLQTTLVPQVELAEGSAELRTLHGRRWLYVATRGSTAGAMAEAARDNEIQLRALSSELVLLRAGLGLGFRLEDVLLLVLRAPAHELTNLEAWWRRRLLPETRLSLEPAEHRSVRAVFAERGEVATSQRKQYARDAGLAGRVRVEAFELHVTEHCNLRCAHCCNTSPYLPHKSLEPEAIAETLATMAGVLHADVFKIMGGEPLLHPRITDVLRAVKRSGIGDVVRLFTNGLLLSKMDDHFWSELDHLTVSSYSSAPVKPTQLLRIEEKARAFDVVLNVKPVDAFSQVMHDVRRRDATAVQQTWDSCWLRHRCLVARDGRFYICTRAAYLPDLHRHVQLTDPFEDALLRREQDSVALSDPALHDEVLKLLNRQVPLHSCQFCLGGDGPREAHRQLSRDDVKAGRLRRLPVSSE